MKDQAKSLVVETMRLGQLIGDELSCTLHPYDLTLQQFNVLRILRGCKKSPATLQYITVRMIHKTSNTTRLVDRLITKGLVERKQCHENRRKVDISITKQGLALLLKIDPYIINKEVEIANRLSESDLQNLLTIYQKLIITL
ncbi:MAG: MarR family transcriptional regulator [Flavobacteriaceae bacterium]|jgi:DNA-binding MarR family transcriptional regulator|nr:MarR family transcriptional regulator [Flavobacteriaceae bacterium]MBT7458084.1 MarR family transcriptional regulator [Flavobacteriaceae bacterium]